MAEYRAYTVGHDGHFIEFEPLVCDSDNEAIEKAKRLVDGHVLNYGAVTVSSLGWSRS
jgi:hypothetical protein